MAGIAVLCAGILSMACSMHSGPRHGVLPALLNAVVIAAYTLVGWRWRAFVRCTGQLYLGFSCCAACPCRCGLRCGNRRLLALRRDWWRGLLGGWAPSSYGIALWAMLHAPVAVVAALRETSILFAMLLARLVLGEHPGGCACWRHW
jgi:drug/metabolite transporter (DMT)-like permease